MPFSVSRQQRGDLRNLVLVLFVIFSLSATDADAQATISVLSSSIKKGEPASCQFESPSGAAPDKAKLRIKFLSDDQAPKPAPTDAIAAVEVDGLIMATLRAGVQDTTLQIGGDTLSNATVSLMRKDAKIPLCTVVTWPAPRMVGPNGPNYTSFVADGAVGKVLRGGPSAEVTGSLGIDHRSEDIRWRPSASGLSRFLPWKSQGEELHALLTVAGSADSLSGDDHAVYGTAMLIPSLGGTGELQGTTIEYHYFGPMNKSGGTWGPRIKTTFTRSVWRVIDTTATAPTVKADTLRETIPLGALDLGLRFTFINHLSDPKGNTYSTGADVSFLWRFASPNSAADRRVISAALNSGHHAAAGLGLSFWIRLRQVTATAHLPYLWPPKGDEIDGLTGFQPTVTMRYSSPLFSF